MSDHTRVTELIEREPNIGNMDIAVNDYPIPCLDNWIASCCRHMDEDSPMTLSVNGLGALLHSLVAARESIRHLKRK